VVVRIKNADSVDHTWVGQTIAPGEYYTIEDTQLPRWQSDDTLLAAIAAGTAVVNNGTSDIAGVSNQINCLKGNPPVSAAGIPLTEPSHLTGPAGAKGVSLVTPNLGTRATWYQKSVKVTTETLTDSGDGLTFTSVNPYWVNIYHPTLTYTHKQIPKRDGTYGKHADWAVLVYVGGTLQSSGYTVNHAAGTITFGSSKSGQTITCTYWHTNGIYQPSEWLMVPPAGKKLIISCVELQYSMNLPASFDTIRFEVWGGATLEQYTGNSAPGATIASGTQVKTPGLAGTLRTTTTADFTQPAVMGTVSVTVATTVGTSAGHAFFISGGGFYVVAAVTDGTTLVLLNLGYTSFSDGVYDLGFGQFRADYRNVWDIINTSNNQQSTIIPKHGGMTQDMFIVPYNYTQANIFDSAVNATLRVCLVTDTPVPDIEVASATFYLQIL